MRAMCDAHYTLVHSDFQNFCYFFTFCTSVVSTHRRVPLHPNTLAVSHLCLWLLYWNRLSEAYSEYCNTSDREFILGVINYTEGRKLVSLSCFVICCNSVCNLNETMPEKKKLTVQTHLSWIFVLLLISIETQYYLVWCIFFFLKNGSSENVRSFTFCENQGYSARNYWDLQRLCPYFCLSWKYFSP